MNKKNGRIWAGVIIVCLFFLVWTACSYYRCGTNAENVNVGVKANDTLVVAELKQSYETGTEVQTGMGDTAVQTGLKDIMEIIAYGDAKRLALISMYPIRRKYPLKDITNENHMQEYFDTMFDERFRRMIRKCNLGDWSEAGWRGYVFQNGLLWVSDNMLYTVNYMSAKEKRLYKKLVRQEKMSLHHSLHNDGWEPFNCMRDVDTRAILRIECNGEIYRMSIYVKGMHADDKPSQIIYGTRDIQGSMAVECYVFGNKDATYSFDSLNDDKLYIETDGNTVQHKREKCYWLDCMAHEMIQ